MSVFICSACLLGIRCRYDGGSATSDKVLALMTQETLVPLCPEQLGGLSTPRDPCERRGDKIVTQSGRDVTAQFLRGAEEVLYIATLLHADAAILKQRSPSCGCGLIYDGSFSGTVVPGDGATTELLKRHSIRVISEEDL